MRTEEKMAAEGDSEMHKTRLFYAYLLVILLSCFYVHDSAALEYDDDPVYFSANVSYGIKFINFGFLKGDQPELGSLSASLLALYQEWFASISADDSINSARVNELGVEGSVTRKDTGITIGRSIPENWLPQALMPKSRRWTLSPYGYIGYSDGKTELSYVDGLEVSFREAGFNFGIGASLFDEFSSRSYHLGWGYAILNNSELKFSSDVDQITTGNTRGYSLDLSMSQYVTDNTDVSVGIRTNRYTIKFETGSFSGEAEDTLTQIYLGLRYYF